MRLVWQQIMLAPFACRTKVLKREGQGYSAATPPASWILRSFWCPCWPAGRKHPAGLKPIDTLALDAGLALKHHFTVMATDAM